MRLGEYETTAHGGLIDDRARRGGYTSTVTQRDLQVFVQYVHAAYQRGEILVCTDRVPPLTAQAIGEAVCASLSGWLQSIQNVIESSAKELSNDLDERAQRWPYPKFTDRDSQLISTVELDALREVAEKLREDVATCTVASARASKAALARLDEARKP